MKRLLCFFVLMTVVSLCAACVAQLIAPRFDDAFKLKSGQLLRETNPYLLRAADVAGFASITSRDELDRIYVRLSDVGFNTICMDLPGLSADGSKMDAQVLKSLSLTFEEAVDRRMASIVRVFGANAPSDPAWRKKAIKTVAEVFKDELRPAYLIDGPDAAELTALLKKGAPDLLVISETGDLKSMTTPGDAAVAPTSMLIGAIPPAETIAVQHFLLPDTPEMMAALDAALANPAESAPWTPDNTVLSEAERNDGFVSLFDGKTLDGWWFIGKNKNGFAVTDGCIEWKAIGGGALYSRERYDNFILRFEWKIGKNGNSGVYIRAPRTNRQSWTGMEIQAQGDHGKRIDVHSTASIYSVIAPKEDATNPEGEWNVEEITADGSHIKVVLNGKTVQDVNLDDVPELRNRLRKGFIGLQDHGRYVAFRNIRVKKL